MRFFWWWCSDGGGGDIDDDDDDCDYIVSFFVYKIIISVDPSILAR